MRLACLTALVLVGACDFNPSDGTAGPDAPDDDDDRDADGRPNATDNCPDAFNPEQFDEDSDAVGDVCDNCPHVANTDQANDGETNAGTARDGAGDTCDPFPTVGGNDIVMFESFRGPLVGWGQGGAGQWTVADGVLSQGRNDVITTIWIGADLPGAVVDTTATLTSGRVDATGGYGFGPVALFTQSVLHHVGYGCDLADRLSTPVTASLRYLDSSSLETIGSAATDIPDPTGIKVAMRVMASTAADVQSCNITGPGLDLQASANDTRGAAGQVALRTFNAAVRFDHIVVFSLTNQ